MLDAEAVAHQLHHVSDIYLIGTATECKELVAVVDFSLPASTPFRLHAVTVTRGATSHITIGDDTHATAMPYVAPQTGMVIYEPYPALMKAGHYRWIADRYNVTAPDPNTHLFLSDRPIDFPGKAYKIVESMDFDKRAVKEIASQRIKANVATRNFPLDAPSLARRLKISEGATCIFTASAPPREGLCCCFASLGIAPGKALLPNETCLSLLFLLEHARYLTLVVALLDCLTLVIFLFTASDPHHHLGKPLAIDKHLQRHHRETCILAKPWPASLSPSFSAEASRSRRAE